MEWLNYHHLYYFWRIAREGSLSRAAEQLHVTHSTVSAQLRALEESLGGELFERRGRRLVLTALGDEVGSYADEIFRLGAELYESARSGGAGDGQRRLSLRIGVVSDIPKTLAYRLFRPALEIDRFRPLFLRQASFERLLEELSAGRLHMILSDVPPPEAGTHRVFAHLLGSSGILLYGARSLVESLHGSFPRSLDGAPMLLPAHPSSLRRQIDRFLVGNDLRVSVEGEFNDAALMRTTGINGHGLFPVREALKAELEEFSATIVRVGKLRRVEERYYVVSKERRVRHAAVSAIVEEARAAFASRRKSRVLTRSKVRSLKTTSTET